MLAELKATNMSQNIDIYTLYNVCTVPWGDIMSTVGGYLEYRGGVQYRGGISSVPWGCSVPWGDIMSTVGGYLEYRGGFMMHVGDIMSTVEGVQYRGGKVFCYLSTPRY